MTRITQFLFYCLICFTAAAQPELLLNRLTTANGLASNEVLSVWQDKKGFIWVGSTNGLQRFDGKRFMNIATSSNIDNFSSQVIHQVTGDAAGNMWLKAGASFGIYNTANFNFQAIPVKSKQRLILNNRLITDAAGDVYILYYAEAIVRYNKKAGCFTDDLPFSIPPGWKITSLFFDAVNKDYWIGCDSGMAVYSSVTRQLHYGKKYSDHYPFVGESVFSGIRNFYIDRFRKQWLIYWPPGAALAKYACYSETEKKFIADTAGLNNSNKSYYDIKGIFETNKGVVWMYGDNVLMGYEQTQQRFVNNTAATVNQFVAKLNQVYAMLEDKEHNVWLATDAGLFSFSPEIPAVTNLILRTDNGENNISSLHEINKQLWISSWGKGVVIFDSSYHRIKPDKLYAGYSGQRLQAARLAWDMVLSSVTGKVWVACQLGFLQVIDTGNLSNKMINQAVFGNSTIRQVTEDKLGNLWFGTQSGRIIKYNARQEPDEKAFVLIAQYANQVNRLFTDNLNRLWICTGGDGLICVDTRDGHIVYTYTAEGGKNKKLFDNYVTGIAQINDSMFAIAATNFHLLNIKTGNISIFNYADGISSNKVSGVVADARGNVWMGTPNGVSRYNFIANNFIRYTERDGFGQLERVGETSLLFKNKKLALASRNQFSVFSPEDFDTAIEPPAAVISDIKLFNTFLPVDSLLSEKHIVFSHKQHSLTFYFSSLSFVQRDKIKYFYRLGNQEWQQADYSLSANYTMLPPGKYNFQVLCENEQHIRSVVTSVHFTILPPFYETGWFISLIIVLLAAEIYFIYRIRKNRREAVERMRVQVARDLHDDMGSTLSTINILSAMAEKKLETDAGKSQEYIGKIKDNSHRMMEAMDDIVWSIKPANDSMQKIAGRMREFSTSVLEAKNIHLHFRVDEGVNQLKLNMAARRDFFLVFKEAINNIAKYAAATQVSVHVSCHGRRLILAIKDNGKGFDTDKADTGNGLNNMRKRADDCKARLSIQSKPGAGTHIVLNMQVK